MSHEITDKDNVGESDQIVTAFLATLKPAAASTLCWLSADYLTDRLITDQYGTCIIKLITDMRFCLGLVMSSTEVGRAMCASVPIKDLRSHETPKVKHRQGRWSRWEAPLGRASSPPSKEAQPKSHPIHP